MLKDRKLRHKQFVWRDSKGNITSREGDDVFGYVKLDGWYDDVFAPIKEENIKEEVDNEEYYLAEVSTEAFDSDYHTYTNIVDFDGVFMAFNLNPVDTAKYFGVDLGDELLPKEELIQRIRKIFADKGMIKPYSSFDVDIEDNDFLKVTIPDRKLDDEIKACALEVLEEIRNYYNEKGIHITRMFGSYVLLKNVEGELKAVYATPIPIKYCPLMIKLLKEVGGDVAEELIGSLEESDEEKQQKLMCELINKVVIKGGYFDTNRPLNSCEANVLFGASEAMSSAFQSGLIDAAVIVSNNLGTIITKDAPTTQGCVKRMTGLFHTTPDRKIIKTAQDEGITPLFPYTGEIDQLEGVKMAIAQGAKRIAVSVAADNNVLHEELAKLEKENGVKIYKFGLCSTGISKDVAEIMGNYADVVWSCASKQVRDYIEPKAIAQVGVKIPVHIMTRQGYEIIKNHLTNIDSDFSDVKLASGEEKPVLVHSGEKIKVLKKGQLRRCSDCPTPCV